MLEEIKDIRDATKEIASKSYFSKEFKSALCRLHDRIESRCDMLEDRFRELNELHVIFDKSESVPTCASNGEHQDRCDFLKSIEARPYVPECCKAAGPGSAKYVSRGREGFFLITESGQVVQIRHCPVHGDKLVYKERRIYCCIDMRAACEKCDYTPESFCPWCGTKVPGTVK